MSLLSLDRKYLEHVADNISDWTKEEELKREAMQLGDLSLPADPKGTVASTKISVNIPLITTAALQCSFSSWIRRKCSRLCKGQGHSGASHQKRLP